MHPRPLQGLRVLDLTRVLAGPYCTMLLADLGADVVKVERPGVGDDARQFGPFVESGRSAYFASINRGKRSIALDLRDDADRRHFLDLLATADVLVENFRAGTMGRLGLSADVLRADHPQLIYASLSGFGHEGLDTDRAAYDLVIQALSGLMSITGSGPGESVRVGTSISDITTGIFAAVAILAAVQGRERTGQGSTVDLAMLDCTVSVLENAISRFATTGRSPVPLGTRHPSITPFQTFVTADDSIVVAVGNDPLWKALCGVLQRPDLAADPRFATNESRTENHAPLEEALAGAFLKRPAAEWLSRLSDAGIPTAPIRSIEEVVNDAHLDSRGMWHQMDDGQGGRFLTAGSPFRMDGYPALLSAETPELDEHREEILREWVGTD